MRLVRRRAEISARLGRGPTIEFCLISGTSLFETSDHEAGVQGNGLSRVQEGTLNVPSIGGQDVRSFLPILAISLPSLSTVTFPFSRLHALCSQTDVQSCHIMANVEAQAHPRPPSAKVIAFAVSVVRSKPPELSVGGKYASSSSTLPPLTFFRIHPATGATYRQGKQSGCCQLDLSASRSISILAFRV